LFDASGRLLREGNASALNLNGFPDAVYLLRCRHNGELVTLRVLKTSTVE